MNQKMQILVVDDDRGMGDTLADILAFHGYDVVKALSAPEAIEKVKQVLFDCVLTDIRMPGMNGVELFQQLRQHQPGLPILFMTAFAADDLIQLGLENGAVGVLNKPLDIQHLLGFLAALTQEHIITVVDDDPEFCDTLADILNRRGFRVSKVTDPHADVNELIEKTQIMILDMKLNTTNGYDVLKDIRVHYPNLPVLLVTGYRQEMIAAVQKAFDLDAYAVLYKPLVIPDLLQKLMELRSARLKEFLKKG
jgi:two-component system, NtrC family, response regulator HydG